jgi:hypothetical protein
MSRLWANEDGRTNQTSMFAGLLEGCEKRARQIFNSAAKRRLSSV